MKVFIAGASGFIGSHLTERFLQDGHTVRGGCLNNPLRRAHPALEEFRGDLQSAENCCKAVDGMDAVILAAANTSGAAEIVASPMSHVTPNLAINSRLLEAAHSAGCSRFLFISSGTVYEPQGTQQIGESDGLSGQPADVYFAVGWMKRYTEILCRTYAQHIATPMQTIVVRPSNIYGPGDEFDPTRSHVTAASIRKVCDRMDPIEVWGDGEDLRDILYIDDFVEGVWRAFNHDTAPFYTVNICSGLLHSVNTVLERAIDIDGFSNARITHSLGRPKTVPVLAFSPEQAQRDLGFAPSVGLEEGLSKTMTWYRESLHSPSVRSTES